MSSYLTDSKNLFIDDVDDDTFLRNSRRVSSPLDYSSQINDPIRRLEQQKQSLIDRRREIEEQTISSTQRSLGLLRNSEQVGIATAEELQRQREQLERTDKRLDEISSTLRFSQKHLNGIKSVFGSLKSYLSGKNETMPPSQVPPSADIPKEHRIDNFLNSNYQASSSNTQQHLLMRMKEDDRNQLFNQSGPQSVRQNRDPQAIIDENLAEMCDSVVKLKGLAVGLSEEIDYHNDLIDKITDKTETVDLTIGKQNKEMNKILKK